MLEPPPVAFRHRKECRKWSLVTEFDRSAARPPAAADSHLPQRRSGKQARRRAEVDARAEQSVLQCRRRHLSHGASVPLQWAAVPAQRHSRPREPPCGHLSWTCGCVQRCFTAATGGDTHADDSAIMSKFKTRDRLVAEAHTVYMSPTALLSGVRQAYFPGSALPHSDHGRRPHVGVG